jgi:hypothetical protein
MKRIATPFAIGIFALMAACTGSEPSKPAPAPAKPAPVAEAPKPASADGGTADARLGMMEKYALWKAKKEADEKLAKELADEESARLRAFDKTKLPIHLKLLEFEKATRKQLDDAAEKLKGKPDAVAELAKISEKQRKAIEAQAKLLRKMDPSGGNSNIGTDHDVNLNLLANDYPEAVGLSFGGDDKPLEGVRKEIDKRFAKMDAWIADLKTAKDAKPEKPAKDAKPAKGKGKGKGKKK